MGEEKLAHFIYYLRRWERKTWLRMSLISLMILYFYLILVTISYQYTLPGDIEDEADFIEDRLQSDVTISNVTTVKQNRSSPENIEEDFDIISTSLKKSMAEAVHCSNIIKDSRKAVVDAASFLKKNPGLFRVPDATLVNITQHCPRYKKLYPQSPRSEEESKFPIAYVMAVHKNALQVEMLLRAIYWPQNLYCIHVDQKASLELFQVIHNIGSCLPNVIVPADRVSVIYEGYSRLEADLICMRAIHKTSNHTWRYVINLTGQEFPLKTNRELVNILRIYDGANDIEGVSDAETKRFHDRYLNQWSEVKNYLKRTGNHVSPPHNITLVKGSAFGVFSRAFIHFVLTDPRIADFIQWLKFVKTPDELIWSTLNSGKHNPHLHAPGSYKGVPDKKPWLAKYVAWPPRDKCAGKKVHYICIFGAGDLPLLTTRKELFANKFYLDGDYVSLYCLNEWIHNKTYDTMEQIDYSYYKRLPFVIK